MSESGDPESLAADDAWDSFRSDGLTCKCRKQIEQELRTVYRLNRWIYDDLLQRGDTPIRGRQPVATGTIAQRNVVVKRLFHGGILGFLGRDRFFSTSRFNNHIDVADHLLAHGIQTPTVIFVSWRRVRGTVRGEVGFDRIAGGMDADRLFFSQADPMSEWEARSRRVGEMVARLHEIDVLHADLNLMNFYFSGADELFILDLDKTRLRSQHLTESERDRNLARLERSIRKQGRTASPEYVERIISAVQTGYESARSL